MSIQNSNCLLCFKNCERNLLFTNKPANHFKKLFDSCVKHLKSEIRGASFQLNHSEDGNQAFCSLCFDLADKLLQIDQQLTNLNKSLVNHVKYFDEKIIAARKANPEFESSLVSHHQLIDDHIGNRSKTVTNEYQPENESVETDQAEEQEAPYICNLAIKDEPPEYDDNCCSDGHESLFDENLFNFGGEDVQIKTEKDEDTPTTRDSRPKRKSAIVAIENITELKTEPGLLSEEDNDSNSEVEGDADEDYMGDEGLAVMSMSEASEGDNNDDKEYKPSKSIGGKKSVSSLGPKGFKCVQCLMAFNQTKELEKHSEETGHVNEKKWMCLLCDKSYYRSVDLKYHRRSHRDNNRTYTCSICKSVLQTYKGFKTHCKSHAGKFFNCTICVTNFPSERALKNHMNTKHSAQELTCHICGKEFQYHLSLKYHVMCHEKSTGPKSTWKRPKGFHCIECNATFHLGKDLEMHSKETGHANEKNYKCRICTMSYYRRLDLKYHMRKHKNDGKYKCEPCNKTFHKASNWRIHNRRHTGETFNCTECDKKFYDPKLLKDHMNIHTGTTPYACDTCDLAFTSQSRLNRHKLSEHNERKIFDCTICPMKLTTSSALAYHMYTHTGEKPFKCDAENCTSTFTTNKKLKLHVIRAHSDVEATFQCDICEKKFKVRDDMVKHRSKHPDPDKDKSETFMCEQCGKCYHSKASLKGHQVKHSGHFFNCEICDSVYFSKEKLESHMKDAHSEDGYFCEICGLKFKKAKELKAHNKTHKEEKIYTCKVCNKTFTRSKNLTVHKRIHAEVRKRFDCDLCGSSYLSKKGLRAHKKLHADGIARVIVKERKCHTCQQSFTDHIEYKKHIKAHESGEKPYQCQVCGNGFTRMDNLKKHIEKCKKDSFQALLPNGMATF